MRKLTCFLIVSIVLLGGVVQAEAFGRILYAKQKINIREARTTQSSLLGSLYPGQPVRTADAGSGFVAIYEPTAASKTPEALLGYVAERFLTGTKPATPVARWGKLAYTTRNVNIRQSPSLSGQKLGLLVADEIVRIGPPRNDWVLVFPKEATVFSQRNARGYASARFFYEAKGVRMPVLSERNEPSVRTEAVADSGQGEVSGTVVPPPPPPATADMPTVVMDDEPAEADWGDVITLTRRVNVRDGRSVGAGYLRTLEPGERVRVDFLQNGWYAVFREDETVRDEGRAMGYAVKRLLEGEPPAASRPAAAPAAVEPTPTPQVAPAPKPQAQTTAAAPAEQRTVAIDRSKFRPIKRPDPAPNASAHGFQYRLLEKAETKKLGENWITLKVFLATTKLPGTDYLKDFATTLWKEYRRANQNLVVLVYLPGMNTDDLAYGVVSFDDQAMLEHWVRKTTLFGTEFL